MTYLINSTGIAYCISNKMENSFLVRLDYKFHRIRTTFLVNSKESYLLITNFHKVCVEMLVKNLNSEGYSIDFGVIKDAIKLLAQDIDGKVIICRNNHYLDVDRTRKVLKVSCFNGEVFEFSQDSVLLVEGTDLPTEYENALAGKIYTSMKQLASQEEVTWTKVYIKNLITEKTSQYFFENKLN